MDTYQDGFNTVADSTWTVDISTWNIFGSSWALINPNQNVTLALYDWNASSGVWNITPTTWTLQNYTQTVIDQTRNQSINEILDQDVEEFMVWPDTTNLPAPGTWQGWCLGWQNGNLIPVSCP